MDKVDPREQCLDILTDSAYIKGDIQITFELLGSIAKEAEKVNDNKLRNLLTAYASAVSYNLEEIETQIKELERKAVAVILGGAELVAFSTKYPAYPSDEE